MKDNFKLVDYLKNNALLKENAEVEEAANKLDNKMIALLQQNRADKHLQTLQAAGPAISIVRTILNQVSGASEQEVESFIQKQLAMNTYSDMEETVNEVVNPDKIIAVLEKQYSKELATIRAAAPAMQTVLNALKKAAGISTGDAEAVVKSLINYDGTFRGERP